MKRSFRNAAARSLSGRELLAGSLARTRQATEIADGCDERVDQGLDLGLQAFVLDLELIQAFALMLKLVST